MIVLCSTALALNVSTPTAIALMVIGGGLVAAFALRKINQRRRGGPADPSAVGAVDEIDDPMRLGDDRQRSPGTEAALTPQERHEQRKQREGLTRDLQAMAVEIEALAKRLTAQVEEQALRLEKLIQDAETSIARLEQLEDRLTNLPPPAQGGAVASVTEASRSAGAEQASVGPVPVVTLGVSAPRPYEPDDPLARNVYQLADSGLKPLEIARRLDEHVGKVELILALREV